MNAEQAIEASRVIGWLSEQASMPGEDEDKRVQMAATLVLAQTYLVEFAHHLANGQEPYDALMSTARGTMPISAAHVDLLRAVGLKV